MTSSARDRVAIVTGAGSGIGLALTQRFKEKGYQVFAADIKPLSPDSQKGVSSVSGPDPAFEQCDVSNFEQYAALFKRAYAHNGCIDLFCANAAIGTNEDVFAESPTDGEPQPMSLRTIDVNLSSVVTGFGLFLHYSRKSRKEHPELGSLKHRMVVTSSMASLYPFVTFPVYAATKGGINQFVRSVARRFDREPEFGITINAVLPAVVRTGMAPAGWFDFFEAEGHLSPASGITKAYEWCAEGGEGESRNGQIIEVSGEERFLRDPPAYANESQKWLIEDAGKVFLQKYASEGGYGN